MTPKPNWWKWSPLRFNELSLLGAIALVALITTAADYNHDYFYDPLGCAQEILRPMSLLAIFALGSAVVIIAGGIDLSTGSTIAFGAAVCAALMILGGRWFVEPSADRIVEITSALQKDQKLPPAELEAQLEAEPEVAALKSAIFRGWVMAAVMAMSGAVVSGFFVGTLHAWLVTSIRLPPFVATLATLVGLRSLARIMCNGVMQTGTTQINVTEDPIFVFIHDHMFVQVAVFIVLAVVTWFLLSRTLLGRHLYALGGNENAARLSGIRTQNVKWFAYCFASITASIAGILILASSQSADPVSQARGYELNAIAAAVVGGCSLQGGIGTAQGTILGALFLRAVIDSVARIVKTEPDLYEGMIVGAVVVAAVTFSQIRQIWASDRQLFEGALGVCSLLAISAFTWLFAASHDAIGPLWGLLIAGIVLALLGTIKLFEMYRHERS